MLIERTTRTVLLVRLRARDAVSVRKVFARKLRHVPKQMKLTYDRGKEMTVHRLFNRDTQMAVYFAHTQSPWERGTNQICKVQDRVNAMADRVKCLMRKRHSIFNELLR